MANWYLFPIAAGEKVPALEGDWQKHSTDDPAQIAEWEAAGYNLAVDCAKSKLGVIDLDVDKITREFVGQTEWESLLEAAGGAPDTYEQLSPRRGRHLIFSDPNGLLRTKTKALGCQHIDTRGQGGYVLIDGSETTDGYYSVPYPERPLAELPKWVLRLQEEHARKDLIQRAAGVTELDLPVNIARGIRHLEAQEVLRLREGADKRLYDIAAVLRDFGISGETSIDLITKHLSIEPWEEGRTDAWIVRKVENAEAYAQNQAGAWGVGSLATTYGEVLDQLPPEEREGASKPDPYKALTEYEQDHLQPPTWTREGLIPDASVVMMYGPPGSYKSFLALDIGMTIASGLAGWETPEQPARPVVYVAGEGPRSIARLRRPAWREVKGIEGEIPFRLVTTMPLAGDMPQVEAFVASIRAQGIRPALVVIDTWARFVMGLNENDAKEAGFAISALEYIKRALHCSVLVIHHSGKDASKPGPRGSEAILGGVDATLEVVPHKATKVVAVHNRRQKDADERETPWLFEGKQVGKSLIFQPITAAAFRALTQADDELDPRKVGAALLGLEARGADKAVTTHVLATKLRVTPADEDPAETEAAIGRIVRQLRAAAKGRLSAYCEKVGSELAWTMPG